MSCSLTLLSNCGSVSPTMPTPGVVVVVEHRAAESGASKASLRADPRRKIHDMRSDDLDRVAASEIHVRHGAVEVFGDRQARMLLGLGSLDPLTRIDYKVQAAYPR